VGSFPEVSRSGSPMRLSICRIQTPGALFGYPPHLIRYGYQLSIPRSELQSRSTGLWPSTSKPQVDTRAVHRIIHPCCDPWAGNRIQALHFWRLPIWSEGGSGGISSWHRSPQSRSWPPTLLPSWSSLTLALEIRPSLPSAPWRWWSR